MKIYLVGGAVRDELLGLPVTERDWVVVGAAPKEMIELGYRPVGKDFPVFLHPETHEEYALARTERKVAKGYQGFKFHADPSVVLEDDLKRRDLTINAIAKSATGELIDPFNGQADLQRKILKHVSLSFAEDPVRILRLARFASRFGDFNIHPETIGLMRQMTAAGEVDALVPERVWQELERTMELKFPWRFFEVLQQCYALPILFPEIAPHLAVVITALKKVVTVSEKSEIRFAAMLNDLEVQQIKTLCKCNGVPNNYRDLALLVARYKNDYYQVTKTDAAVKLNILEHADAFHRPKRLDDFLQACEASFSKDTTLQKRKLQSAYKAASKVSAQPLLDQGLIGEAIGQALHKKRKQTINNM